MSFTIIAAVGAGKELGKDNDLIWKIPEDLKFFKEKTKGKTIIMGERTFESLGGLLPNRKHIVITLDENWSHSEVEVYNKLEEVFNKHLKSEEEVFVIGGGQIYGLFVDVTDKMYLTEIDKNCDKADTFFPLFDKADWDETRDELLCHNEINYAHVLYKRKIR